MHANEIDITVHTFMLNAEAASQLPSQNILAEATRFVISTTHETCWRAPPCIDPAQFAIRGPCFQYDRSPDTQAIKKPFQPAQATLKEWDESVCLADHELWSLAELDEFDHGRLHHLLDTQRTRSQSTTPAPDARLVDQPLEESTRKRPTADSFDPPQLPKRIKLHARSLRSFLPAPHFYPPLLACNDSVLSLLQSATWPTTEGFSPLHPHRRDTCEECLKDPYTRVAWVIPVRGCLEWGGATSASVLSDIQDSDSLRQLENPPAPHMEGSREILWTTDALRQFWDVLKGLREARNLGALSLSFYAVPSATTLGSMEQYSYVGSHRQTTPSRSSSSSPLAAHSTASATGPTRSSLRAVDHFKIYHDAPYTKVVRSALHGWSYRNGDKKIRLLKGAKFVLVDECSQGLLLC
ncbi:hypothetical protein LXA43DRAFT_887484 [Ganoderma leucocontextum]|nr:hypothetical protein LXA43DRAFT_887484 [Ganoderma leucocontextum]